MADIDGRQQAIFAYTVLTPAYRWESEPMYYNTFSIYWYIVEAYDNTFL